METLFLSLKSFKLIFVHIVSTQVEEGWWSGSLNGKSGLFPSNFVKEMDAAGEDVESSDATPDDAGKDAMNPNPPEMSAGEQEQPAMRAKSWSPLLK